MTGLPIHLFLHQHPTLPPSTFLACHQRPATFAYTTCTHRQTTLLPFSSRSHIDRLLLQSIPSRYLSAFSKERERERVPSPDPSFERIRTHLFRCQNFSTPTQFVTSRRRACRGAVLVRADEKKRRRTPPTMMIGSVSTSDDDMLMYGYAGDT